MGRPVGAVPSARRRAVLEVGEGEGRIQVCGGVCAFRGLRKAGGELFEAYGPGVFRVCATVVVGM